VSSPARIEPGSPSLGPAEGAWQVRPARLEDVPAIAAAVSSLLVELGGKPPELAAMEAATRKLVCDGTAGAVIVAEAEQALVGVLAASWQTAIHVPGRYGLIQDLWITPTRRSQAVGATLIAALSELAHERGVTRIEVGLPRPSFTAFAATEAFYLHRGFTDIGPRMRKVLS
jgi:GNAT superfamily N-acetyltransferase